MGIYDRDYASAGRARRAPFGPGLGLTSPRHWSGNTWIIVLCVAVFVIDALLTSGFGLGVQVDLGSGAYQGVSPQQFERGEVQEDAVIRSSSALPWALAHPIIDPDTRQRIGEARFVIMPPLQAVGHFSTAKGFLSLEVWRLVGFQFLHGNATHLLFNMLGLFFFGAVVEQHLGRRRYLAFYLVCGIFGAVMYLLLNLLGQTLKLPPFLAVDIYTPLVGASAGVFGVLMAAARLSPNATVLFMFIIPMRMSTLIYILIGLAVLTLVTQGRNAGGEAAHIGGAIAGWFFIRNAHLLGDFFEVFGPRRARAGAPTLRPGRAGRRRAADKVDDELDRILEKVGAEGLHGLTRKERRYLERASKRRHE